LILQELLQGAADAAALLILRRRFAALPVLAPKGALALHADAGALCARCRWAGVTPRSPHDFLIAATALAGGVPLLHDDRDFECIAGVVPGLRLLRG